MLLAGCSPTGGCISGQSAACSCADGRSGAQICAADGTFGACVCGSQDGGAGTAFRYVFVTSTGYKGFFGGLNGADNICAIASRNRLPGLYKAWVSVAGVNAIDRMTSGAPWHLPPTAAEGTMGPQVFASRSALTQGPAVPINRDETGATKSTQVWTGTTAAGGANPQNCADWSSTTSLGYFGDSSATGTRWTTFDNSGSCNEMKSVYCFQQE